MNDRIRDAYALGFSALLTSGGLAQIEGTNDAAGPVAEARRLVAASRRDNALADEAT